MKEAEAKANAGKEAVDDGPREFSLHRYVSPFLESTIELGTGLTFGSNFFQMRLDRRAAADRAKREQTRLRDPTFFPSAPSNDLA